MVRNGLVSQSGRGGKITTSRGPYSGRESQEVIIDRTTMAASNMHKSGFTYYPGQPLKVSQESLLGQTLNKFELGEHNKSKLKSISGVEYYK